ncbi:MAG: arylsulfatase [Deltaproteobacteria bacterium]|nr:arylsulfatase [Deltaproteobacteria bacterium]
MGLKLKTKKSLVALCAFGATNLMMSSAANQDTVVGKDSGASFFNRLSGVGVAEAAPAKSQYGKPNIVIIMTDNQGYGDLGCYGGVRAETPRIDQLASEGIQFLDFQVEPGSTPTRAAFQTGRMPVRSGTDGYVEPGQPGGLHPMEVTIAELLKNVGYSTAMYGKWHLGENSERQPQMQGYDEWYGITNTTVPVDPSLPGFGSLSLIQQKILYAKGGQKAKIVAENTIEARSLMDRELTERSVKYIKKHANKKNPFFLFVPFTNPHHPVIPHPDFVGKSKGGAYTDALMEMDYNTGLILDTIDKTGIRENTIVVYFSDNGPTRYSPEADHNGDPGIWSGELGSGWEGGLRTVGMMRWPGKIKANWKSKEMFHVLDLFNTFARITGAEIPKDRAIDGVDQTDFLLGKQDNSNRNSRLVIYDGHPNPIAIRYKQFKFHWIIYDKWKPFSGSPKILGQIPLLYNLDTDPKEMYDLFGRSGGVAPFEAMARDVLAPYLMSLKKFPNLDYSKMTRKE